MRTYPILTLAAALLLSGSAGAQVTVLRNATLIDGSGAAPQSNITIVMENGRIRDIGAGAAPPSGASVVDLAGKFVVPGIINGHGHVGPAPRDRQLRQYALYGVTTTTSMAADPDDIAEYKARQEAGDLRGARILTVKYRFTTLASGGYDYKTPAAARGKVDEIVAKGADFIKVWIDAQGGREPKLSREFVAAVFDQARRHGKLTMAHIVELADARMAVEEGVNLLVHNVRDRDIPPDFLAMLKARDVSVISTLAREEGMFRAGGGAGLGKKLETLANDPARASLMRAFEQDKANVKKLLDAGVRLGFGTDSGGAAERYFIQGFFEHRQMELLVAAGLTPMQVIQSFSKSNAEALGIVKDFGTLAKGKAADLLVLARNPLDDIANMRAIEAVYLGGEKFE